MFAGPFIRHDLYWENNETTLAINFDDFTDDQSGIGKYEMCVGTEPGKCDTVKMEHLKGVLHGGV